MTTATGRQRPAETSPALRPAAGPTPARPLPRARRRRTAGLLAALALGLAVLTGCGSEGVDTSCSLNSCTLTFDRGVTANANILGVDVKLVGAENGVVDLEVAGQRVNLNHGQTERAGAFDVTLQKLTEEQVVVLVERAAGS
ncbi:MAG TPA: hypothetical protein VFM55_10215 [Micromonosporaceae bacterium]|nr:hypothetical protein [Micromonosporaceae bacterium]